MSGGDAEQGSECGMAGAPAVEAKDEFIEVGLEVLAAQPGYYRSGKECGQLLIRKSAARPKYPEKSLSDNSS